MRSIREVFRIPLVLAGVALAALLVPSGCASRSEENLGFERVASPPSFLVEAGADGCSGAGCEDANAFRPLCKAVECPVPYATCTSDSFRCETNFDFDNDNCGACGVICPHGEDVRNFYAAEWFCQSGQCRMACDPAIGFADCNGLAADGCEADVMCDENNCGGCGIKCPDGLACRKGNCGCPPGLTACGDDSCNSRCLRLDSDDYNCGTCGNACPEEETPPYPNAKHGCGGAECGKLKCVENYADCNKDLAADGCETSLLDDAQNCGSCGHKCPAGKFCSDGKCVCSDHQTACPWGDTGIVVCTDLDTDPNNCGVCGSSCPSPPGFDGPKPSCRLGHCELQCPSGYADCDGKVENGCETLISADPRNCGACGVTCDLAFGQPCVGGVCLLAPCNSGGTQ